MNLQESIRRILREDHQFVRKHISDTNPHTGARNAFMGIPSLSGYDWDLIPKLIYPDDKKINKEMLYPASKRDVKRYMKQYIQGSEFPAIVLIDNGKEYSIADGQHRLSAAIKLGVPIYAYVGTEKPKLQESIRRILREELDNLLNKLKPYLIEGKYLYHYTPTYNLDDIEEEGLIPRKTPNSFYKNGIEGIFLTNKSSLYGANLPQDLMNLMDEYYENEEEYEKPIVRLTIDITQLNPNKITWDDDYIMNLYKWNKARTDEDKIIESIDIWGTISYKGLIPPELIINHDFDYQS